jgi:hypothetical protein
MASDDYMHIPIPVRLVEPWLENNKQFIDNDVAARNRALATIRDKRSQYLSQIRTAEDYTRSRLAAVDAASAAEPLADLQTYLIQATRVDDDGQITLGSPYRLTGVYGHEISQTATVIRVVEECKLLAEATDITIADTSFWSLLMEVNQAITLRYNHPNERLVAAVDHLTKGQLFLSVITNLNVIAMSKQGEASTVHPGVSDREAWGQILEPGEYIQPLPIADALHAHFGVERRGFTNTESDRVRDIYDKRLGVIYYKPHPWSRAYRIEAQMDTLKSPQKLMPILSAVRHHTQLGPSIVEPWPQFMADYVAKQISSVAWLYGQGNHHRTPFGPVRTGGFE